MIIDSKNETQKSILTHKCFYQTTSQIMHEFERKGYANSADETAKVIAAYHDLVQKKSKNNYNKDYNEAFKKIDEAIKGLANKVFYGENQSLDVAYKSFAKFDYINAIIGRQRIKKKP
jgi:primosomal protein N'